jgi:hypothetical protein
MAKAKAKGQSKGTKGRLDSKGRKPVKKAKKK